MAPFWELVEPVEPGEVFFRPPKSRASRTRLPMDRLIQLGTETADVR